MKIHLPYDFEENLRIFMRRAGYAELVYSDSGKTSYTKRLSRDNYPRFHVYINEDKDLNKSIDLHLDQKKPSYAGSSAHSGEYDSDIVMQEGSRLQGLIKNQMDNRKQKQDPEKSEKKGLFAKLFK